MNAAGGNDSGPSFRYRLVMRLIARYSLKMTLAIAVLFTTELAANPSWHWAAHFSEYSTR